MKKKTVVIIVSLLLVVCIALGGLYWNERKKSASLENALEISHNHAFAELVTGISELDTALQKSIYATSPSVMSAVCTDIFGKAMTAQMSLGALPFSTNELEKTAAFISRVGDYSYTLSKSTESYSDEELQNMKELSKTATALAHNFKSLQTDLTEGGLSMDKLLKAEQLLDEAEDETIPDSLSGGMRTVEEEFPEIPSLIYDGPFSMHLDESTPKLLENDLRVSEAEARKAAAEFMKIEESKLQSLGKSQGKIPSFMFATDYMTIEVSEKGAKIINFLSSHTVAESKISVDDAIKSAQKFLSERGIENMAVTYYMTQEGVCTINFAYEQNGVICYPDLVKVGIALDTGAVVNFESRGYIMAHSEREIPEPVISKEDAQQHISADLTIDSHKLCIIPTSGQYEIFAHEFACSNADGNKFLIYVNAESGEQEKILILLEDENGSLTI